MTCSKFLDKAISNKWLVYIVDPVLMLSESILLGLLSGQFAYRQNSLRFSLCLLLRDSVFHMAESLLHTVWQDRVVRFQRGSLTQHRRSEEAINNVTPCWPLSSSEPPDSSPEQLLFYAMETVNDCIILIPMSADEKIKTYLS